MTNGRDGIVTRVVDNDGIAARVRGRARKAVQQLWADGGRGVGGKTLLAALAPAEAGYRLAVAARNLWYDRSPPPPLPLVVASVGNLVVGGTGKTPVVRWLREWCAGKGARAAVVCRGYGGDETAMYRRWFGDDGVFADRSRTRCIGEGWKHGCDLAIMDDGFQHRRVHRDLDILLVAAEDPLRARLLPRGPYREPLSAAKRATHVLLTRRSASRAALDAWGAALAQAAPGAPVMQVEMQMGEWSDLNGAQADPPQGDVMAVSAIARPREFHEGLRRLLPTAAVQSVAFADHHPYSQRDADALLARRAGRSLVCTEKDAVKLAAFPELASHCVAVGFHVVGKPPEPLSSALTDLARRRRASSLAAAPTT